MRQIEKYPGTKMVQNWHSYEYVKFKNYLGNSLLPEAPNPPKVPPPPEIFLKTSIF